MEVFNLLLLKNKFRVKLKTPSKIKVYKHFLFLKNENGIYNKFYQKLTKLIDKVRTLHVVVSPKECKVSKNGSPFPKFYYGFVSCEIDFLKDYHDVINAMKFHEMSLQDDDNLNRETKIYYPGIYTEESPPRINIKNFLPAYRNNRRPPPL